MSDYFDRRIARFAGNGTYALPLVQNLVGLPNGAGDRDRVTAAAESELPPELGRARADRPPSGGSPGRRAPPAPLEFGEGGRSASGEADGAEGSVPASLPMPGPASVGGGLDPQPVSADPKPLVSEVAAASAGAARQSVEPEGTPYDPETERATATGSAASTSRSYAGLADERVPPVPAQVRAAAEIESADAVAGEPSAGVVSSEPTAKGAASARKPDESHDGGGHGAVDLSLPGALAAPPRPVDSRLADLALVAPPPPAAPAVEAAAMDFAIPSPGIAPENDIARGDDVADGGPPAVVQRRLVAGDEGVSEPDKPFDDGSFGGFAFRRRAAEDGSTSPRFEATGSATASLAPAAPGPDPTTRPEDYDLRWPDAQSVIAEPGGGALDGPIGAPSEVVQRRLAETGDDTRVEPPLVAAPNTPNAPSPRAVSEGSAATIPDQGLATASTGAAERGFATEIAPRSVARSRGMSSAFRDDTNMRRAAGSNPPGFIASDVRSPIVEPVAGSAAEPSGDSAVQRRTAVQEPRSSEVGAVPSRASDRLKAPLRPPVAEANITQTPAASGGSHPAAELPAAGAVQAPPGGPDLRPFSNDPVAGPAAGQIASVARPRIAMPDDSVGREPLPNRDAPRHTHALSSRMGPEESAAPMEPRWLDTEMPLDPAASSPRHRVAGREHGVASKLEATAAASSDAELVPGPIGPSSDVIQPGLAAPTPPGDAPVPRLLEGEPMVDGSVETAGMIQRRLARPDAGIPPAPSAIDVPTRADDSAKPSIGTVKDGAVTIRPDRPAPPVASDLDGLPASHRQAVGSARGAGLRAEAAGGISQPVASTAADRVPTGDANSDRLPLAAELVRGSAALQAGVSSESPQRHPAMPRGVAPGEVVRPVEAPVLPGVPQRIVAADGSDPTRVRQPAPAAMSFGSGPLPAPPREIVGEEGGANRRADTPTGRPVSADLRSRPTIAGPSATTLTDEEQAPGELPAGRADGPPDVIQRREAEGDASTSGEAPPSRKITAVPHDAAPNEEAAAETPLLGAPDVAGLSTTIARTSGDLTIDGREAIAEATGERADEILRSVQPRRAMPDVGDSHSRTPPGATLTPVAATETRISGATPDVPQHDAPVEVLTGRSSTSAGVRDAAPTPVDLIGPRPERASALPDVVQRRLAATDGDGPGRVAPLPDQPDSSVPAHSQPSATIDGRAVSVHARTIAAEAAFEPSFSAVPHRAVLEEERRATASAATMADVGSVASTVAGFQPSVAGVSDATPIGGSAAEGLAEKQTGEPPIGVIQRRTAILGVGVPREAAASLAASSPAARSLAAAGGPLAPAASRSDLPATVLSLPAPAASSHPPRRSGADGPSIEKGSPARTQARGTSGVIQRRLATPDGGDVSAQAPPLVDRQVDPSAVPVATGETLSTRPEFATAAAFDPPAAPAPRREIVDVEGHVGSSADIGVGGQRASSEAHVRRADGPVASNQPVSLEAAVPRDPGANRPTPDRWDPRTGAVATEDHVDGPNPAVRLGADMIREGAWLDPSVTGRVEPEPTTALVDQTAAWADTAVSRRRDITLSTPPLIAEPASAALRARVDLSPTVGGSKRVDATNAHLAADQSVRARAETSVLLAGPNGPAPSSHRREASAMDPAPAVPPASTAVRRPDLLVGAASGDVAGHRERQSVEATPAQQMRSAEVARSSGPQDDAVAKSPSQLYRSSVKRLLATTPIAEPPEARPSPRVWTEPSAPARSPTGVVPAAIGGLAAPNLAIAAPREPAFNLRTIHVPLPSIPEAAPAMLRHRPGGGDPRGAVGAPPSGDRESSIAGPGPILLAPPDRARPEEPSGPRPDLSPRPDPRMGRSASSRFARPQSDVAARPEIASRPSARQAPAADPVLHLRIHRIDVHAPAAAPPRPTPVRQRTTALSLDDYLTRRAER